MIYVPIDMHAIFSNLFQCTRCFLNMLHILSIVFIKQGNLFTAHGGGIMLWFNYMPGLNFISLCYWV